VKKRDTGSMLVRFNAFFKIFTACFSIFLFFLFMSGLDFIVHKVLYNYGLQFSFEWAHFYWWLYGCTFLIFSGVVSLIYWLSSNKSGRDFKVCLGLFLSIILLFWGGLTDVLWFIFWDGGLPSNDVVWWWMPWYAIFGFWNSLLQLALLCSTVLVTCLLWVLVFKRKR